MNNFSSYKGKNKCFAKEVFQSEYNRIIGALN